MTFSSNTRTQRTPLRDLSRRSAAKTKAKSVIPSQRPRILAWVLLHAFTRGFFSTHSRVRRPPFRYVFRKPTEASVGVSARTTSKNNYTQRARPLLRQISVFTVLVADVVITTPTRGAILQTPTSAAAPATAAFAREVAIQGISRPDQRQNHQPNRNRRFHHDTFPFRPPSSASRKPGTHLIDHRRESPRQHGQAHQLKHRPAP